MIADAPGESDQFPTLYCVSDKRFTRVGFFIFRDYLFICVKEKAPLVLIAVSPFLAFSSIRI